MTALNKLTDGQLLFRLQDFYGAEQDAIEINDHEYAQECSDIVSVIREVMESRKALEAAEKRIAELTGKPASEYADDADLLFEIDFCDDLSTSIQVAQWLKELRIRRAAGIGVNVELQGGKCE
ncbi:hypothetical protein R5O97_05880 [Citrobacter freundii]|nr:hypothetical protein R5O97_05880 [Citrobacter freundii]